MANIIDYLEKYNDISFKEHPFNPVDALVLSQFVYLKWEHVIPLMTDGLDAISLVEMNERMLDAEVFSYEIYAEDNRKLLKYMLMGKRFATMKCNYLSSRLDDHVETQFLAFTVFLEGALPVILYRGTDETLLGWKEDYNMTSNNPVAGQRLASLYLNRVSLRLLGDFILTGHSKGGNLAVYAAISANSELQERIKKVYNFDGPHFRKEILLEHDISSMEAKIKKYIPKASVVGILLETEHKYKIVDNSAYFGVAQHYPYRWCVDDDDFVYVKKLEKSSLRLNEFIIKRLYSMSEEQIRLLGKSLFDILYGSEADTLQDISKDKIKAALGMLRTMKDIEPEIRDELKKIL